jgi:HSP20 family protein
VTADLPGVSKENIRIDVDGNRVAISAELKRQKEEKDKDNVVMSERYEGKVFRSLRSTTR